MQIAANKESQRAPNEVVYYGQFSKTPTSSTSPAWTRTADGSPPQLELVQFLNHVAGAPGIPALLKPATIKLMTTPAPAYPPGDARYARGWMVRDNGAGNWWHNGSLPGTTSIMVRTPTGFCWAALCKHPHPTLRRNQHRPRSNDVEHGPHRPIVEPVTNHSEDLRKDVET